MKTVPSSKLSQEGCDIIVNAAIEKAKELKQVISVCVVDAGCHLMAFKRMTNGRTHNTLIAQTKARCAALTTAATGWPGVASADPKPQRAPIFARSNGLRSIVFNVSGTRVSNEMRTCR